MDTERCGLQQELIHERLKSDSLKATVNHVVVVLEQLQGELSQSEEGMVQGHGKVNQDAFPCPQMAF